MESIFTVEPLRMTKSPEDLHLSHSKSSNENQGSIVRFHCGVISDQSLPVQLRWVRGIKLAQREVPRLEGRTYVTDGGTLTLNLTSFLGKLRKFYSKEGPTVIEHFKQSHDKPRAVPTDDEANDEDDESYYPYYDDDDIRAAASIFYTCKMNDSLHFIEASARLRLLPSPSTNIHISKSTNNGRADVRDFNIVGQNINDDVMTQEVRGYAEDQSESQSVESKILMWGKNLLGGDD